MTNKLFIILIITLLCLSNNLAKAETQAYVRYKVNPYASSQQLGCSPNTPESIQNYMRNVYQRIESFANIPVKDSYGKIAVSFYLDINGKVSNLNITKSSGDFQSDRLAMEAVIKSAPFGPFPIGFNSSGMQFNFVFYLQPFTQPDNTQTTLFPNSSISSNPFIPEIKPNIKNNTTQTAQYNSNYYQSQ
ncbi:MAG: TonB family protein, partial [Cyanobacteriota bacterium]